MRLKKIFGLIKKHKIILIFSVIGGAWGLISLILWIMTSGGPTSGANPSIVFMILTLPASILLLTSYYLDEYKIVHISSTLLIFSIPMCGILIGSMTGYLINKFKNKN